MKLFFLSFLLVLSANSFGNALLSARNPTSVAETGTAETHARVPLTEDSSYAARETCLVNGECYLQHDVEQNLGNIGMSSGIGFHSPYNSFTGCNVDVHLGLAIRW